MLRCLPWMVALLAGVARAGDAFPWDGSQVLVEVGKSQRTTWTVTRRDGEVHIAIETPWWTAQHRARPDGTPLSTLEKRDGFTHRVTYLDDGVRVDRTAPDGATSSCTVKEAGLWDGYTLGPRLAGAGWKPGKKVHFRVMNIDDPGCPTYPMVAEQVETDTCGAARCHHVKLGLDDLRRIFAPVYGYFFAVEPGARLLRYQSDGRTFEPRATTTTTTTSPDAGR